jgi:2-keto-4-pentenoate hydratase/2-oxohepta-3-ene-1,7-dioic acid hydratase in catechol pathway
MVGDAEFVDLSDVVTDFDGEFFASGRLAELPEIVSARQDEGRVTRLDGRRIGAPIARPHQVIGIGLNYVDHAVESGMAVPSRPVVFTKAPNSMVGPYDDIVMPGHAVELDYEVELGAVIGRPTYQLTSPEEALSAVAGYMVVNDVSERAWQLDGGQWAKGKSAPTFFPCGPYLATADEVPDPSQLALWLTVNGETRQSAKTADMVFGVGDLVHHLSQYMALEPGDVIATGTPSGVALGMTPPGWLSVGDVVSLGVDGLGRQESRVVAGAESAR